MSSQGARLSGVTKELWNQWQQTKTSWRDQKALEFEERYLADLISSVDRTVTVIEQLEKLMNQIKKDCE